MHLKAIDTHTVDDSQYVSVDLWVPMLGHITYANILHDFYNVICVPYTPYKVMAQWLLPSQQILICHKSNLSPYNIILYDFTLAPLRLHPIRSKREKGKNIEFRSDADEIELIVR